MKIIEENKEIKEEEVEKNTFLLGLQENEMFQKHYVNGVVLPVIKQLRDLRWIYEAKEMLSASDEDIADTIRQNRTTYTVIMSLLNPILSQEAKDNL